MPTVTILDLEFEVVIDSATPFDRGRSSGPPEYCYPPEGGEIEWHVDEDQPIAEFIQTALDNSDDWKENVEEQLQDDLNGEPEPPEPWNDYD